VDFYVVYIQEAHPSDEWQVPVNVDDGVVFEQPKTFAEREEVAQACSLGLDVSIPMLIDEMTNETNVAYAAIPDRLYLVDEEGRIAFRGDRGPMGFRPGEFERAIQAHLGA
jgi:hypothetical protein